jgi:hypothetical protein
MAFPMVLKAEMMHASASTIMTSGFALGNYLHYFTE